MGRAIERLSLDLPRVALPELPDSGVLWWALVLASGAGLLLAPLAVYLALNEK